MTDLPKWEPTWVYGRGVALRDYFAGQALRGLLGMERDGEPRLWYMGDMRRRPTDAQAFVTDTYHWASAAYKIADAMLAEREKGQ